MPRRFVNFAKEQKDKGFHGLRRKNTKERVKPGPSGPSKPSNKDDIENVGSYHRARLAKDTVSTGASTSREIRGWISTLRKFAK
jgi:hypothetical protein